MKDEVKNVERKMKCKFISKSVFCRHEILAEVFFFINIDLHFNRSLIHQK